MINAVLAIAQASARDCARRGSLILVLALGCVFMLALRYTAVYAFGEELNLLLEFGLSNLVIGGALVAILCAVPVSRSSTILAADRALITRAVPRASLTLGRFLGTALVMGGMFAVWATFFAIAIIWFGSAESSLFSMARKTNIGAELRGIVLPVLLVYLQSLMLAGFAIAAASRASMLATTSVVISVLVLGILIPDWASAENAGVVIQSLAWVVPDLRPYSLTETLYGDGNLDAAWIVGSGMSAIGYALVAVLVAGSVER